LEQQLVDWCRDPLNSACKTFAVSICEVANLNKHRVSGELWDLDVDDKGMRAWEAIAATPMVERELEVAMEVSIETQKQFEMEEIAFEVAVMESLAVQHDELDEVLAASLLEDTTPPQCLYPCTSVTARSGVTVPGQAVVQMNKGEEEENVINITLSGNGEQVTLKRKADLSEDEQVEAAIAASLQETYWEQSYPGGDSDYWQCPICDMINATTESACSICYSFH
jgi:hypothetical protein